MSNISRLSDKCQKCSHVNNCNEKIEIACAVMERPEKMSMPASEMMTTPIAAEMLVKHSYRDVKINSTQTITIDLEELKKDLERRLYKGISYPMFEFGA